jgi:transposase-like protein
MGTTCKRCGLDAVCKNGFVVGKQRYLCKVCGTNFTEGDGRKKHSPRVVRAAIDLYVEGNGFRRISRLLKKIFNVDVCYQLVIHWIKSAAEKIDLMKPESEAQKNKVPLLELDELFSYIKKKQIKSEYGLLLIETGYVLLDLKSSAQALKPSENFGIK